MKTVSSKISDEEYEELLLWCQEHNTTTNELIKGLIRDVVKGKSHPTLRLTHKLGTCPVCADSLHLYQEDSKCYLICISCDFAAFLGAYKLPEKVQDYQDIVKKMKEV